MDGLIGFILGGFFGVFLILFIMGCCVLSEEDVQEYLKLKDEEKISKGSEWTGRE